MARSLLLSATLCYPLLPSATRACEPCLGQAAYPPCGAARRTEGVGRTLLTIHIPVAASYTTTTTRATLARCGTTNRCSTSTSQSSAAPTPCRTSTSSRSRRPRPQLYPHTHLHAHATPTARPALPTPWRLRCMLSRAAAAAVSQADRLQRLDHRIALRLLLL